MNTLRARLAILLVVAIISVVGLASLAAISVVGLPGRDRFYDAGGKQIVAVVDEAKRQADSAANTPPADQWFSFRPAPLAQNDAAMTRGLRDALDRLGSPLPAAATRLSESTGALISVPVEGRGWIVVALADVSPPSGGWLALISWMVVIIVGAITVALFVAYRMTQPLHLIEHAVAAVGSDGMLPSVPETGSTEVRATARVLNRLSAGLKSALQSRMRLVAAAGHDLRTPMTRMRLRAEFVADEDERLNWLGDLDELDRIADSAIGLVREEVDTISPEPLRLDALVAEVVDELAALQLPIALGPIEPAVVSAAPWSLKRAFRNLATNAATHGGGATVTVARINGKGTITILDSGSGIPADLLGRVFEPFFQVDPSRRRSFGGAGLGLAIAREIVERYGGTIRLENRPEGGLRQTIAFPEVDDRELLRDRAERSTENRPCRRWSIPRQ